MAEINPEKWVVALAGFANDWLYSREWSRIVLYSIPTILLLSLSTAVFVGGILDRTKLRNKYVSLGQSELKRWQDQLSSPILQNAANSESTEGVEGESESEEAAKEDHQLSTYAQMLFRRAHLLEPSIDTQFVIGASMWQRGALAEAKQTLTKIAPPDQKGFPPAHAIMAKLTRDDMVRTRNPALLEEFQHHANIAISWEKVFPDVVIDQATLLWQQKKIDESVQYLAQAAKGNPDFYALLVQRAAQANNKVLVQSARREGIEHFRAALARDPKVESNRIHLAELLFSEPEGDAEAEQLFLEGLKLLPRSKLFARALSGIYRIRFLRKLQQSNGKDADIPLLDRALQVDSSNPDIAETIATMMQYGVKADQRLENELNRVLVSGQATMATHAILSELYLQKQDFEQAKLHLEQVMKLAPMAVKYANNLAFIYAKDKRFEDAEKVAIQTLSLVKESGAQREPYVDELYDTLGMIYQSQEKVSDAIASYETSIKLRPQRMDTRKRLVALYRKSGNKGVADAHEEAIRKIEQALASEAQKSANEAEGTNTEGNKPNAEAEKTDSDGK